MPLRTARWSQRVMTQEVKRRHQQQFYINGQWVEPTTTTTSSPSPPRLHFHQLVDPSSGTPLYFTDKSGSSTDHDPVTIPFAGASDVDAAVQAARTAFELNYHHKYYQHRPGRVTYGNDGLQGENSSGSVASDLASPSSANATDVAPHLTTLSTARSAKERLDMVRGLLHQYERKRGLLGEAMAAEMGAPLHSLALGMQFDCGLDALRDMCDDIESAGISFWEPSMRGDGDRPPSSSHSSSTHHGDGRCRDRLFYEPVGVCALITPWNWPMNQIALKVGAAALAGCTMVLKPSEYSPLSATVFTECVHDAGFPPGVFNLIHGNGDGAGRALTTHPDIDCISFTGSTRAGQAISAAAAAADSPNPIKPIHLELGGKGANIIFESPDASFFRQAVKDGVKAVMLNSGQTCNAPTRMLVQRSQYAEALDVIRETVGKEITLVGNDFSHRPGADGSFDNDTDQASNTDTVDVDANADMLQVGPVVNEQQFHKINGMIQRAVDETERTVGLSGSPKVLCGGGDGGGQKALQTSSTTRVSWQKCHQPNGVGTYITLPSTTDENTTGGGFFIPPTVFYDVPPDHNLFQEEIFGPVLTVTPFDTEEDAVRMANMTRYGLSNYIQCGYYLSDSLSLSSTTSRQPAESPRDDDDDNKTQSTCVTARDGPKMTEVQRAKVQRVASRLRSGMVEINSVGGFGGVYPFGGMRQSGNGGREGGRWGVRAFQQLKAVSRW